jgi:hypothetical protein
MSTEEARVSRSLEEEEERLRAAIQSDAQGLRDAVDELQAATLKRIDTRRAIARNPMLWLGGALVLGWMIGSRLK